MLLAVKGLAFLLFPFSKGQKAVNNRKPDHPESEKEVIIFVPFKKIGGYQQNSSPYKGIDDYDFSHAVVPFYWILKVSKFQDNDLPVARSA